jgi:hypothetical protein
MRDRTTRRADLENLAREYKSSDRDGRRRIEKAAHRIINESKDIQSMRQELIKAHRRGDKEEIKDIHYYVSKHMSKYGNEKY